LCRPSLLEKQWLANVKPFGDIERLLATKRPGVIISAIAARAPLTRRDLMLRRASAPGGASRFWGGINFRGKKAEIHAAFIAGLSCGKRTLLRPDRRQRGLAALAKQASARNKVNSSNPFFFGAAGKNRPHALAPWFEPFRVRCSEKLAGCPGPKWFMPFILRREKHWPVINRWFSKIDRKESLSVIRKRSKFHAYSPFTLGWSSRPRAALPSAHYWHQ